MMYTNAQVALLAATAVTPERTMALEKATLFKEWLDKQDQPAVEDKPEVPAKDHCADLPPNFEKQGLTGWAGLPGQCGFAHNIIRCTSLGGHMGKHISLVFDKVWDSVGHWADSPDVWADVSGPICRGGIVTPPSDLDTHVIGKDCIGKQCIYGCGRSAGSSGYCGPSGCYNVPG